MKTVKKAMFAVLIPMLILLANSYLVAQEADQPTAHSLEDCIAIAMQNNLEVLTGQNSVAAAKSRSISAKSAYLPQASVQTNAFAWGSQDVLNKTKTGTAVVVSQNIFDGGLRESSIRAALYGVTKNTAGLARTQQTVSFNVSRAYYEVLRAKQLADVAQAGVRYNEELRDQVKSRAALGDAAVVDVLPVEAQLAGARVNLLSARNSVRTALIELQSVMGLSSQPGFDVREIYTAPPTDFAELDIYVATAIESRPDILEFRAATGVSRAAVSSRKTALYPRPTISAEYQHQVSGGFTESGTQIVGGVSFDVFDGGANRAAYREAQANLSNAEAQANQLDKDIRLQVEEAHLNLLNSRERVAASAISLDAANKNYLAQKERYSQALGTTLELLNAEVQVVTAESDDVQSRYDCYIAASQMDYAVGRQGERYEK